MNNKIEILLKWYIYLKFQINFLRELLVNTLEIKYSLFPIKIYLESKEWLPGQSFLLKEVLDELGVLSLFLSSSRSVDIFSPRVLSSAFLWVYES